MTKKEDLKIGMTLKSPVTNEIYEVTTLGKRYLLVEITTTFSKHEFPRRYDEIFNYILIKDAK